MENVTQRIMNTRLSQKEKPRICKCSEVGIKKRRHILQILKSYDCDVTDFEEVEIPIIFHICYDCDDKEGMEKHIKYTLRLLNLDFSKSPRNFNSGDLIFRKGKYADTYNKYINRACSADMSFNFSKVVYEKLGVYSAGSVAALKSDIKDQAPAISPDQYLNVWIVDAGNDVLGYAEYPWSKTERLNGIVLSSNIFGIQPKFQQYNMNKMFAHCIGHWLGLFHVFNKDYNKTSDVSPKTDPVEHRGDLVLDTPLQSTATTGNPYLDPRKWPNNIDSWGETHFNMFMNYMDLTDDLSMFMFTIDQIRKMRVMIKLLRPKLLDPDADMTIAKNIIKEIQTISPKLAAAKNNVPKVTLQPAPKQLPRRISDSEASASASASALTLSASRISDIRQNSDSKRASDKIDSDIKKPISAKPKLKNKPSSQEVTANAHNKKISHSRTNFDRDSRMRTLGSEDSLMEQVMLENDYVHMTGNNDTMTSAKYRALKEAYMDNKNKYMLLKKKHLVLKNKYLMTKNELIILKNKAMVKDWHKSKKSIIDHGFDFSEEDSTDM